MKKMKIWMEDDDIGDNDNDKLPEQRQIDMPMLLGHKTKYWITP